MTTFETRELDGQEGERNGLSAGSEPSLVTPFAAAEVMVNHDETGVRSDDYASQATSPFTESFTSGDEAGQEMELTQLLLAELEDDDFAEALEALAYEASARVSDGIVGWNRESSVPAVDLGDVGEWMEAIETRADQLLQELEVAFDNRSVESVTDDELDQMLEVSFPELESFAEPFDAQELFFGRLKKKLRKVARAVKRVVKKGVRLATKFLPLGRIYALLRPVIKPLLKKVLARAIGKLPRSLRGPARKLARRYGLRSESEYETEFEYLAAEFDAMIADGVLGTEGAAAETWEAEIAAELGDAEGGGPDLVAELDAARDRLVDQILEAEDEEAPIEAMEQFIPAVMAALPLIRGGVKIVGRKRVVKFVAGLLARLIRPMVGRRLAKPLSMQIADKGLAMLRLEAESEVDDGRLGAEALVASAEEAISEVFSLPDEWLENELLTELAVQEAFQTAATRHFPESVLRRDLVSEEAEAERGVWVMMPRSNRPMYRYKKYSLPIRVAISKEMADGVEFSDGETLAERLADEGVESWPVDGEVEAFELLPGAHAGHVAAAELVDEYLADHDGVREFDTLDEAGTLPLPSDMERSSRRRRGRSRRLVRVTVGGRRVRRRSPVSVRLDLSGSRPVIRLHRWIGERQAHAIAENQQKQRLREVVSVIRRATGKGFRRVVARRLDRMLRRHGVTRDAASLQSLSDQLFDGLVIGVGAQIQALGPSLAAAAKDPAAGLTITASFQFESKDAIGKAKPPAPTISVRAGRHRD